MKKRTYYCEICKWPVAPEGVHIDTEPLDDAHPRRCDDTACVVTPSPLPVSPSPELEN